ncbi:MAG TPA: UrcA family protein [Phenylobacterium sp.]|nr:UrcA family protein [Phenylobacterium sp.]
MVRLAVVLAMAAATSAAAEPRHELLMARVPLGDLDLRTAPGVATLLQRLNAAARELCAPAFHSPVFPAAEGRAWRCRREAITAAVARLNSPPLTLAWAQQLSATSSAAP